MDITNIKTILANHAIWLDDSSKGSRAVLTGANLRRADLRKADLRKANLINADLSETNLMEANLMEANLTGANLSGASLTGAVLTGANLRIAFLRDADLSGANLTDARFVGANLKGARLSNFQLCPQTGQFRAFKKVRGDIILELLISKKAARTSSLVGRKCRASRVKVISATNLRGHAVPERVFQSIHNDSFAYEVGKWVDVPDFDPDIRVECTRGIHFYMTREEAVYY